MHLRMFCPITPSAKFISLAITLSAATLLLWAQPIQAQSSLSLNLEQSSASSGAIRLNGSDSQRPSAPFLFDWGDGTTKRGSFPQRHTYADPTRNYVVTVTAFYPNGQRNVAMIAVPFVQPRLQPIALPQNLRVSIPVKSLPKHSKLYSSQPDLRPFADAYFTKTPRETIEYILSVAATIQFDLVNQNLEQPDGHFRQVVLHSPSMPGAGALWFLDPPTVAAGDSIMDDPIQYSSLFHELAHNMTLNTPSDYIYGGKIDGQANTIYSEALAQIFQHVTASEVIRRAQEFGIPSKLVLEIDRNAQNSMANITNSYNRYIASGKPFSTWNDASTPGDESFDTFMTVAYTFFQLTEQLKVEPTIPVRRMMHLLQHFDDQLNEFYDQRHNTPEASAFRSTLLVTAMSYAFQHDLRDKFRALNFPISDPVYRLLMALVRDATN